MPIYIFLYLDVTKSVRGMWGAISWGGDNKEKAALCQTQTPEESKPN